MPKKLVVQEGAIGTGKVACCSGRCFRHRKGCVPKKLVVQEGALGTGKAVCLRSLLFRKVL